MATTTTNFGWDIPQSTDLVKDGATAIAALGQDIDTSMVDLKGGTTGQVLSKASNTDMDFTWVTSDDANAIQNTIVDAKGDLITATAADTPARLAVGADYRILQALSTEATGLQYAGGWTSYTPTWTASSVNPSLGNGTLTGKYRRIGDMVDFNLTLTMGSTTTYGTGSWRFTLPIAVSDANFNYGYTGNALDNGTRWYVGLQGSGAIIPSTTIFAIRDTTDANSISATVPFTWTTADVLLIKGSYQVS